VTFREYCKLEDMERIALQAILGSHWKREMFDLHRVVMNIQKRGVFFERIEDTKT
jgi:hypothetical protein